MGLGESALRSLRVASARSLGPLQQGSSLGFSFLVSGAPLKDPFVVTTVDAVKTFVSCWWHKSVSVSVFSQRMLMRWSVCRKLSPGGRPSNPCLLLC